MKFKSIRLQNFMRYKGDNKLEFSVDPENNVTVVLGDNTFGKTTVAQAFRWGLYEQLNETRYTKKKDVVLLNKDVAASLSGSSMADVLVEIIVSDGTKEWRFVRRASFNRKSANTIAVKQIGPTQLTMQIKTNGVWGAVINNDGSNQDKTHYKKGCVDEMINSFFPYQLSNYLFFDGERWNDLKNKTEDIRDSIFTILGIDDLLAMKKHLKDGSQSAVKILRSKTSGSDGEYVRIQNLIQGYYDTIETLKKELSGIDNLIDTEKKIIEETSKIISENKKVEDDQKQYASIERDVQSLQKTSDSQYASIVQLFSNSAQFFAAGLLSEVEALLEQINLEGKDIPGVTIETLEYLIENDECLCGTKFSEDEEAKENIMRLKRLVPPEMLGGAAGKLVDVLRMWQESTSGFPDNISSLAQAFTDTQDTIADKMDDLERLGKKIDRKTNLGPTRQKNKDAMRRRDELIQRKANLHARIKATEDNIEKKIAELDEIGRKNEENRRLYRAMEYAQALYEKASKRAGFRQNAIIDDLNELIGRNFEKMFNEKEKYAKLETDYRVHLYYRQVGSRHNIEEEVLSNGEIIALNFVYIVSILELAKRYKAEDAEENYGEEAVLELPLVLDGPFSALSTTNTGAVAGNLPKFAEQVIIFMLDKDWEASNLSQYALPAYCYRVKKENNSNSSELGNL